MRILIFILALIMAMPAFAQDKKVFCTTVAKHVSKDANYKPGVDVYGNSVVSADLNSNLKPIFDPIIIPIEIDIKERFGLDLPDDMEMKPEVAYVKIYSDGRVEYNDTDVTQQTQELCSSIEIEEPPIPEPDPQPVKKETVAPNKLQNETQNKQVTQDGQKAVAPVISGPAVTKGNYGKVIEGEAR